MQRIKYILFVLLLLRLAPAHAQVPLDSPLYKTLRTQDSLLFNAAFNKCDTVTLEKLLSDDFEFYHDKGGITSSKAAFISTITNNICSQPNRPRRELVDGTLQVYPLMQNNVLYGAIQMGDHRFYAQENGNPAHSRAKFVHVWILEQGQWKFKRGLSFDHQDKE
ncbi:nuclear transport factor 2 family protein [Chitinophaga agrisoli]|uniref:Nuclear transport factor 2 family protein n=1 Tax=Chitinophaga agrisoli TaxID=2607653 RepID=A0A5B2VK01_9BACT|nr:nuclear transport factor 2 family protein [Chitinophaga agrisoli]KAA2238612.1 nuclear transport factor 2 family protein [Chitinophaga agrisoli]